MITAAELPESNSDSDLYRKMLVSAQGELDKLKILYREKDGLIIKERTKNKNLFD